MLISVFGYDLNLSKKKWKKLKGINVGEDKGKGKKKEKKTGKNFSENVNVPTEAANSLCPASKILLCSSKNQGKYSPLS